MRLQEPNGPQSIHYRCKLICTCLWLKSRWIANVICVISPRHGYPDRPAGWKVFTGGSAFNSYNLMLTNLLLYLTNVNSHDFFIHFDTSFSPSDKLKMVPREISIPRETIARILGPFVSREISPLTQTSKQGYKDFSAQRSEKQGFSKRKMKTKNEFFVSVAGKYVFRLPDSNFCPRFQLLQQLRLMNASDMDKILWVLSLIHFFG